MKNLVKEKAEIDIMNETMKTYNRNEIFKSTLNYFNGDELATNTWINKYALKDSFGNIYELNPDDTHKRLAKEIYRIEQKYPNPLSYELIFSLLEKFKYLIPAGGSLTGIGNDLQVSSLSNCFVVGNSYDSYGSIFHIDEQQVQLMKRRGGVGHDLSHLRPSGTPVKNSALTSTGIVPFMERYSNSTREVAQDGRRGALMLTLSIKHPDAENFIDAKLTEGKITGANISVKIGNDFMKSVINDKPYIQQFPINSEKPLVSKEIDSKRLWDKIIHNVWKSAEPGVLFWDKIISESPADCYANMGFATISTNPCGEIPLCPYDSCRLLAINLLSYVKNPYTKDAEFDMNLFKEHTQYAQRIMDDIIDLEIEKIDKIIQKIKDDSEPDYIKSTEKSLWESVKTMAHLGRRTGLGITSEGDMLAAMGYQYGSTEGIDFAVNVQRTLATQAYISSVILAKERGAFNVFDINKEKGNPFLSRVLFNNPDMPKEILDQYKKTGRRNIACLTIAPTGTVSIMTQTTSGIEPAFGIKYKRKRKINPNDKGINPDNIEYDKQGDAFEMYNVYHHGFVKWAQINGYDLRDLSDENYEKLYKISPYYQSTSADIDWVAKVAMQGQIQQWIDHSISVTVNIPNETTEEIVSELYMTAWKSGCKGITVYREGSREGILVSDKHQQKMDNSFKEINVPKRPKILECDVIHFNNKGEKWVGVLGLVQDRPIEIFTGKWDSFMIPFSIEKGFVIKVKDNGKTRYDFQYVDADGYKCTMEGLNRAFNREYHNYARLISGVLRQGMPLIYVYELVDGLKLEDGDSITDWKSGVKRLIKRHIKDGVKTKDICPECGSILVYAEGCKKCTCGYTACG